MKLKDIVLSRHKAADDYLELKRPQWDRWNNLLHNRLDDQISKGTKSQVFDPKLATFAIDRSARVMAQPPSGKVIGVGKNDLGASAYMNLILDKYVVPNANAQFDFITKSRMMNLYASVYGNMFALVDWDVRKDGYIGPDMWLIDIKNVFPQVGALSLQDSDYVIIRTWHMMSFFKGLKSNQGGFKNVDKIIEKLKEKTSGKAKEDTDKKNPREVANYPTPETVKGVGPYEVLTMYEKDRWVSYVPAADMILRETKNLHENDELPLVCKYSIPVLGDFFGMGDFERGASMQQTINSSWNLYMDAVKMSIYPPVLLNKNELVLSSAKYGPAEKWLAKTTTQGVVQPLALNPMGISTFNNTYQVANASLMSAFGTTDTAVTKEVDPGYGKTPQALEMQQARESARDNADRYYQERFVQDVMKKFCNLISKKMPSTLPVRIMKEDLDELAIMYPEVKEFYDDKKGTINFKKERIGNGVYDYKIVPGSTYAIDQTQQQKNLGTLLTILQQNPNLRVEMQQKGKDINIVELIEQIVAKMGLPQGNKIIVDIGSTQEDDEMAVANADQKLQEMLAAAQNGTLNEFAQALQAEQQPTQAPQSEGGMSRIPMPGSGLPVSEMGYDQSGAQAGGF